MRAFRIGTLALFIISLPLFLFSLSIGIAVNSLWLYRAGFVSNNISHVTGIAPPELEKAATELIHYFNSGDEPINVVVTKDGKPFKLFNEREIAHLRDVKQLIFFDYKVLLATFLYLVMSAGLFHYRKADWRWPACGMVAGSIFTLVLMAALGLGILIGFEQLFYEFHLLTFANDFWLLDPATDYLIMLFPETFWYHTFLFVAILVVCMAVVVGLLGSVWLKRMRKVNIF